MLSLLCNLKTFFYLHYNPFLNVSLLHYNAVKAVLQTSTRSKHTLPVLMSKKTHQLLRLRLNYTCMMLLFIKIELNALIGL
jgi:hypothetical protein